MATVLKAERREFREEPNKADNFRIWSDVSRAVKGVSPQYLNFDLRQLNPGQYSAPYHFHRYAEEMFMIVSGSATLRTPDGLESVEAGDIIFFETGETGAHQLHNHAEIPCVYLDVRTYIGFDLCEYPDSEKIFIAPSFEIYKKESAVNYFDGEEHVREKWEELRTESRKLD